MTNKTGLVLYTDEHKKINLDVLYKEIEYLNTKYPNFKEWYYGKVIPDLKLNKRRIYCTSNYKTIIIVKYSEGKICTFININSHINTKALLADICNLISKDIKTKSIKITVPEDMVMYYQYILEDNDFNKNNRIKYIINDITRYDIEYMKLLDNN